MSRESGTSPIVSLQATDGARAEVRHDGAHVTSWRPVPDARERLFLSARTEFREGIAIRGGIPVIFPQFAAEGPLPRHGFARTMRWAFDGEERASDGDAIARFSLRDSDATRAVWPAAFLATVTVRVGGRRLAVALDVENTGDQPLYFTAALHSYLCVENVADAALEGLHGQRYRVSGPDGALQVDDGDTLRADGEIDRVYVEVPCALRLHEPTRALTIGASGFPDVVVWNPGPVKAAALPDMEPEGERRMLCVESAVVQSPVCVDPGARWRGEQQLTA